MSKLDQIRLPEFGRAARYPKISVEEYNQRLTAAVERMQQADLDFLVVYADREHFANMAYLIGFDPRFEEALLILDRHNGRTLLVGNECLGYLPDPELECDAVLFQDFSLLGQSREESDSLQHIFAEADIGSGASVGCVGWKYFDERLVGNTTYAIEIPAYIVDLLRDMTGGWNQVSNVTNLFMNPDDGLRIINSVDQLAQFEFAATRTSDSIRSAMELINVGVAEYELESELLGDGLPLSCHPMINFGEKVKRGLSSPSRNLATLGDAYVIAYGIWGALNCRAGAVAQGPDDLPRTVRDFYHRFVTNYFDVVVTWYENLRIGVTGGEVFAAVEAERDPEVFDFAVNPGHYIHLDEWLHSPFVADSTSTIRSGMAFQMDIIPVSKGPFCYTNVEDTIAIADEQLRQEIANRYPDCWERIQARRRFMSDSLGIRLDPCVLPFSNMPAWLPPYVLSLEHALVNQ